MLSQKLLRLPVMETTALHELLPIASHFDEPIERSGRANLFTAASDFADCRTSNRPASGGFQGGAPPGSCSPRQCRPTHEGSGHLDGGVDGSNNLKNSGDFMLGDGEAPATISAQTQCHHGSNEEASITMEK
ncbi:hypothetical protein HAX54_049453 [Datura stramonium]|uniref:Uncharacterized protein n=1 Tax=Datura stramonium TaxID=4076 RepID=A0ABS8SVL4_DATST|nr:hypothetical protein [Datura stramonium]